jgi:CheY-like chemotaxis protein
MRAMVNVLLVEDNALLRSSLGIALGHHGVRLVASCADASEAIEHADEAGRHRVRHEGGGAAGPRKGARWRRRDLVHARASGIFD